MRHFRFLAAVTFSLLCLAACDKPSDDPGNGDKPSTPGELSVRISSFNVLADAGKAPWASRKDAIRGIVTRSSHNPDIICFQECHSDPPLSDLQAMFADAYTFHKSSKSGISPSLIAWKKDKFQYSNGGVVDMLQGNSAYVSSDYTTHRYAHWVKLQSIADGRELFVFDIHVKTNGSSVSYQQLRYDCITALCPKALGMAGNCPVVICGDFNNYMNTVDGVISAPAACKAGGFTEAASVAAKTENLRYKTSGIDLEGAQAHKWSGGTDQRIDFIFASCAGGFSVPFYQTVIDFASGSDINLNTPVPSDHHPVSADFVFKYE